MDPYGCVCPGTLCPPDAEKVFLAGPGRSTKVQFFLLNWSRSDIVKDQSCGPVFITKPIRYFSHPSCCREMVQCEILGQTKLCVKGKTQRDLETVDPKKRCPDKTEHFRCSMFFASKARPHRSILESGWVASRLRLLVRFWDWVEQLAKPRRQPVLF